MNNIEISKIIVDENTLSIKDAQGRENLASLSTTVNSISTDLVSLSTTVSTNYLPLSGGTLTGNLTLDNSSISLISNISLSSTTDSTQFSNSITFRNDINSETLGSIQITHFDTGAIGLRLVSKNLIEDTTTAAYNNLQLIVHPDGTRSVAISEAAPWRSALHLGTSGELPITIAQGGTGATTASEAWTALGGGSIGKLSSLSANDIPNLDASKITTGNLDVNRLPTFTNMQDAIKYQRFNLESGKTKSLKLPSGIAVIFWMRATTYGMALVTAYNDTVQFFNASGTNDPTITYDTTTDILQITNNRTSNISVCILGATSS